MQTKKCKSCGASMSAEEYFCPDCGEPMFVDEGPTQGFGQRSPVNPVSQQPEQPSAPPAQASQEAAPYSAPYPIPQTPPPQQDIRQPAARPPQAKQATTPYPSTYRQAAYPAHRQPGQAAPAGAAGQEYNRERIRRLIEEDRRKKKRLFLIGVPGLLVVGSLIALILLLFVFGGGLSPEEYKEQALEIHTRVTTELGFIERDWDRSDVSDELYSECYGSLCNDVEEIIPIIEEVLTDLGELQPPEEVASLEEELSAYYDSIEEYMVRAQGVFAFSKDWSSIWEGAMDISYAMDNISTTSTPAQDVAWMDQDISTINSFIDQFNTLTAPPECKNMLSGIVALLEEQKGLIDRLKRAVINYDQNAYNAVLDDWDFFDSMLWDRIVKLWDDLESFRDELWGLTDRGKDLQRELGGYGEELGEDEQVSALDRVPVACPPVC